MKAWGSVAACGLALAALALPSGAAGSAQGRPGLPRFEVQRANTSGIVLLEAGGYEIAVVVPNPHVAILAVSKLVLNDDAEHLAISSYALHAHSDLADGVLRARLGPLGQVSMRFRAQGKARAGHNPDGCRGRRPLTTYGTFSGRIRITGEDGYVDVSKSRAKGLLERSFRLRCRRNHAGEAGTVYPLRAYVAPRQEFSYSPGDGSVALLVAASRAHGRLTWLRASHRESSPPGAEVSAGVLEARPGIAIGRVAYASGGAGTLLTSLPGVHPATATLAPPAPFHGTADFFENSSTSHRWDGSLGVALPGLDLPLTGPGFLTSLCVLSPLRSPEGCDFAKPKPLVPARLTTPPALRRWLGR